MNHRSINIDETKFKNASKKILSHLKKHNNDSLTLQNIHEILSRALGFRNFSSLQFVFNPPTKTYYHPERYHMLLEINDNFLSELILLLLPQSDHTQQCLYLFKSILPPLLYLEKEKIMLVDWLMILEFSQLKNLISLCFSYTYIPSEFRLFSINYLNSLPHFDRNLIQIEQIYLHNHLSYKTNFIKHKDVDLLYEEHKEASLLLQSACQNLHKIEENNFVIANPLWFNFNENNLIKQSLMKIVSIQFSWLMIPAFQEWIKTLQQNNQLRILKLSDLIQYVSYIKKTEEKNQLMLVIKDIFTHFETCSTLSLTLDKKHIS